MLPGVYMVKFDMLSLNLMSKITKKTTRANNLGKTAFKIIINSKNRSYNAIFNGLERSLVGLRWEFDRILPWGVLYLILKLKLVFLYLMKLINLIKNLIKALNKALNLQTFITRRHEDRSAPSQDTASLGPSGTFWECLFGKVLGAENLLERKN